MTKFELEAMLRSAQISATDIDSVLLAYEEGDLFRAFDLVIESMEDRGEQYADRAEQLEAELDTTERERDDFESERDFYEEEKESLEDEIDELESRVDLYRIQFDEMEEKNYKLEKTTERLKAILKKEGIENL